MNDTIDAPVAEKPAKPKRTFHVIGNQSYPDKCRVRWNWPKATGTIAEVVGVAGRKFIIRYVVQTRRQGRVNTAVLRAQVFPQSIQAV